MDNDRCPIVDMRIYLTGASGFAGSNLRYVFTERHGAEVVAPGHADLDVTDGEAVHRSVVAARPDAIVHTAIWNDIVGLRADRRRAWEAHVLAMRQLTDAANLVGAQMVLISTDWVFDGTQGPADESRSAIPLEGVPVDTRLDATGTVAKLGADLASLDLTLARLRAEFAQVDGRFGA